LDEFTMPLRKQLWLYFGALACIAMAAGIHDSTFNNFLSDSFHLSADARGRLEFPRELPGLLVVLMTGVLCMLPVTKVGLVATGVFAVGLTGLAFSSQSFPFMVLVMMTGSAGMHLLQPVGASIVLGLSTEHNRGTRLGQAAAVGTCGTVIGAGLVWLLMSKVQPQYRTGFLCAAFMVAVGGVFYALMHIPHLHQPRARLVIRRKFKLYYLLEFLAGARKQIFITFGPWVLIKVYGLPATSIAGLLMLSALIGIVFKPLSGMVLDRLGERKMMIIDGLVLSVVCLGYGYAQKVIPDPDWARRLACACYILDEMLFALGNARSVYLSRLTDTPQELNSSLAFGVSINHLASMSIPAVAGAVWMGLGYERLFLAASVFAVCLAAVATRVPAKRFWTRPSSQRQ
jgi:MFS family permease